MTTGRRTPLTDSTARALDYLADLGFRDLYLGSAGDSGAESRLKILAEEAAACRRCPLAEGRKQAVFASGPPTAELMFIGEGPGAQEDRRGLPFVGPSGQLLDRIIAAIGRKREEVYVANVVKCRPPRNRDPRPDEIAACRSYLEEQIEWVNPRVIVLLGRVAAQALLATSESLGRLRGRWWQVQGVETRVTYHPAALLHDESLKRPCWQDMQHVRARLDGR